MQIFNLPRNLEHFGFAFETIDDLDLYTFVNKVSIYNVVRTLARSDDKKVRTRCSRLHSVTLFLPPVLSGRL